MSHKGFFDKSSFCLQAGRSLARRGLSTVSLMHARMDSSSSSVLDRDRQTSPRPIVVSGQRRERRKHLKRRFLRRRRILPLAFPCTGSAFLGRMIPLQNVDDIASIVPVAERRIVLDDGAVSRPWRVSCRVAALSRRGSGRRDAKVVMHESVGGERV